MTSKTYYYQFSEQKVFATDHAPISFNIKNNYLIIAMENYTVAVYDINNNLSLVNSFSVCGYVIKIDYCTIDDYVITMEAKDHSEVVSVANNSVRTYHNWRDSGAHNKMKFRAALGSKSMPGRRDSSSPTRLVSGDKAAAGDVPFKESEIEVLEFLHLNHPLAFSIYTNHAFKRSFNSGKHNQNFSDTSSTVSISENTYVHLYRLCQVRNIYSPVSSKRNSKTDPELTLDFSICFQHMYTVNFNFMAYKLCILGSILAAGSNDKVQIIQILEDKQKCESFSEKLGNKNSETESIVKIEIEKCWLTTVSNERKNVATKQKMRPKEILGPTHDLDTASITLLRYADSKELTFETLLFRKYNIPSVEHHVQNIHLARIPDFEEYGFFIVKRHEIVQYSHSVKRNEVVKIAEYNFKNEYVLGMAFSDQVNLMHVAFANGDLETYNSRLCSRDLIHCDNIYKKVSLTRFGKVTLMGLTDVKSSGLFVFACCKYNFTEDHDTLNAVVVSSDSWNFYLFSQPPKEELKKAIISYADHKGTKKLLQMLMCSLLVFPSKAELNNRFIEDVIICCLKSDSIYSDIVPSLLSSSNIQISEALNIFQTLETKELYNTHLFKRYAKNNLIRADFSKITEDQFRWVVIKILDISVTLLFDVIVTNNVESFLKVDLLTIEGISCDSFESVFLKLLYFSAHGDFDIAEPLVGQLDENELKEVLKCQLQLLYHEKHHTSFGWLINLANPQLYAEVMAYCFVNNLEHNNGFSNLEVAKQVGQCAYILVLEELVKMYLKEAGFITHSTSTNRNSKQFVRRSSSCIATKEETLQCKVPTVTYKHYIDQLLLLYHEFSFNVLEFCPHKVNALCRKIPVWLKEFRYNTVLNILPPFHGVDPFTSLHTNSSKPCLSLCCQSYLIKLQCLLSWSESSQLTNTNVIEATCESNNHPAWKSLQFLLLQLRPVDLRSPSEIINFLSTVEVQKEDCLLETYLFSFGGELSIHDWENVIKNKPPSMALDKLLKHVLRSLKLEQLIDMLNTLRAANNIAECDYHDWVEKSGRLHSRDGLFKICFKQLMDENS